MSKGTRITATEKEIIVAQVAARYRRYAREIRTEGHVPAPFVRDTDDAPHLTEAWVVLKAMILDVLGTDRDDRVTYRQTEALLKRCRIICNHQRRDVLRLFA